MKFLLMTALLALTMNVWACTEDGKEGILPENDLWLSTSAKNVNDSIDEAKFNEVIDSVVDIYAPIISNMGGNLVVERAWEDGTVNAYAQRSGSTWKINMFGGLARHEAITPDGFALVVCHEIGHHIGGAPKKGNWWGSSWASNEGQSDYWATLKCLRKVFATQNNQEVLNKLDVPETVTQTCSKIFNTKSDQDICARGSMAGLSTAKLFQALRRQTTAPKFNTPDPSEVSKTDHNHPQTQCRLDTYFAGAVCEALVNDDVSQDDEVQGVCYRDLGHTTGVRPLCWFKPDNKSLTSNM
jgi:hypothetical protein